jgi:hypothetical protein
MELVNALVAEGRSALRGWSRRNRRVTLRWILVLEFYAAFTMLPFWHLT